MFYDTSDLRSDELVLVLRSKSEGSPEKGLLPAYCFDIRLQDDRLIGRCDLRIGHNEKSRIIGNVGYGIFPAYRGRHYGAKACELIFKQARKHAMEYLLISCDAENAASARTCELVGGRLVEIADLPTDSEAYAHGKRKVRVYRVEL